MRVPRINPLRPGGSYDRDEARKRLMPAYRVACETVDYWKEREIYTTRKKEESRNFLSRLFWQVRYLSAVGNGAEAERCRDGLLDPHWGISDPKTEQEIGTQAYKIGIERENARNRKPEP